LKDEGIFITQQVGGMNVNDLNMKLGSSEYKYHDWCLNKAIIQLEESGFEIIKRKECLSKTRFYDIGSIIYYLRCIPWQVEEFNIEKYFLQ
jgi:hypothetical protein